MVHDIQFVNPKRVKGTWIGRHETPKGLVVDPIILIGGRDSGNYPDDVEEQIAPHSISHESLHHVLYKQASGTPNVKAAYAFALDNLYDPEHGMYGADVSGMPQFGLMRAYMKRLKK